MAERQRRWMVTAQVVIEVAGGDVFDAVPVVHEVLTSCGVPSALGLKGRATRITYDSTEIEPESDLV